MFVVKVLRYERCIVSDKFWDEWAKGTLITLCATFGIDLFAFESKFLTSSVDAALDMPLVSTPRFGTGCKAGQLEEHYAKMEVAVLIIGFLLNFFQASKDYGGVELGWRKVAAHHVVDSIRQHRDEWSRATDASMSSRPAAVKEAALSLRLVAKVTPLAKVAPIAGESPSPGAPESSEEWDTSGLGLNNVSRHFVEPPPSSVNDASQKGASSRGVMSPLDSVVVSSALGESSTVASASAVRSAVGGESSTMASASAVSSARGTMVPDMAIASELRTASQLSKVRVGIDPSFSSPPEAEQMPMLWRVRKSQPNPAEHDEAWSNRTEHAAEPEESGLVSPKRRRVFSESPERDAPSPSPSSSFPPGPAGSKPVILFPTALAALLAVPTVSAALAAVLGLPCSGSDFVFFNDADVLLELSVFLHNKQLPLYVASFSSSGLEEEEALFSSATAILDYLRSGMDGRHVAARTLAAFLTTASVSSRVTCLSGASYTECDPAVVKPVGAAVAKVHLGSVVCTDLRGRRIAGYFCHEMSVESHRDGGCVPHARDEAAPLAPAVPPLDLHTANFGSSAVGASHASIAPSIESASKTAGSLEAPSSGAPALIPAPASADHVKRTSESAPPSSDLSRAGAACGPPADGAPADAASCDGASGREHLELGDDTAGEAIMDADVASVQVWARVFRRF
jgi:hypothetical protein